MAKTFSLWMTIIATMLLSASAMAVNSGAIANGFTAENANTQLEEINHELKHGISDDKKLHKSILSLQRLQEKATDCVEAGTGKLKNIDAILNDKAFGSAIQKNSSDNQYLTNERNAVASQAASCRVFIYRADQLLAKYATVISESAKAKTLEKVKPVWGSFSDEILLEFTVSKNKIYQHSGISELDNTNIIILISILLGSIIISFVVRYYCSMLLIKADKSRVVINHTVKMIKRYILLLLPIAALLLFLHPLLYEVEPTPFIISYGYAIFVSMSIIALVDFVLYLPTREGERVAKHGVHRKIFRRFLFVSFLILLGYLFVIFLREQELTEQFINITRTSYVTALLIAVFWLCWAAFDLPYFVRRSESFIRVTMQAMLIISLILLIALEWLGYHDITISVLEGVILSTIAAVAGWGAVMLVERAFTVLENDNYHLALAMRRLTNKRSSSGFVEFYMLRIALYILFIAVSLVVVMQIWGASLYQIDLVKNGFKNGFQLLDVTIIPLHIVIGLVVFSVLHMMGRIFSARLERKHTLRIAHEGQVAIASIINYISFAVSVIVGLLVAGVNFTGLAIIAGALSVGIGFGLQTIVNNFLSGLILLIQQPIKTGDRVVVDGIEGYIIKIRILSTQIKTVTKEDVIIPNSDLMTHPVTNYMFRDSFWRVTCKVGVMYGSDTELVRQVLLQIAEAHEDVIHQDNNKPIVHFKEFGDSALLFELWCIIKDVNKKFAVESELNFAIDKAFREHDIVIAFPQRDLHIKGLVNVTPESDKS